MAIIKNGKIRGKVGNAIYRVVGDKEIVQSAPKKYELTENSKIESNRFGKASKLASKIYRSVKDFALNCVKETFYRELVTLFRGLQSFDFYNLDGGENIPWTLIPKTEALAINKVVEVDAILGSYPTATFDNDRCTIQIPEFDMNKVKGKLPTGTGFIEFTASVLHHYSEIGVYSTCNYSSELLSIYDVIPEQEITLPVEWASDDLDEGLVVVCFGLRFYANLNSRRDLNTMTYNPSAILGIWYKKEV